MVLPDKGMLIFIAAFNYWIFFLHKAPTLCIILEAGPAYYQFVIIL